MDGGQAQKSLEGRHRGAAAVEVEGELVEVGLQVLLADAVMGAPHPGLEVSKDPMDTREDLRRPLWGTLGFRAVTVAHALQRDVASPPIGQDDCSALDIRRNEAREGGRGGVENHVEPDSARPLPPHLDSARHQRFLQELSSSFEAHFRSADVDLVHLNLLLQGIALGPYHRPPQLVEHGPGRLVRVEPQLPLKLERRQTWRVRGDHVRRLEPARERHAGPVQHRPCRNRGLIAAGLTLPELSPSQLERLSLPTPPTDVPLRPSTRREVGQAGCLISETLLEILQRPGKVWPPHARTLHMVAFGVNPIGTTFHTLV